MVKVVNVFYDLHMFSNGSFVIKLVKLHRCAYLETCSFRKRYLRAEKGDIHLKFR